MALTGRRGPLGAVIGAVGSGGLQRVLGHSVSQPPGAAPARGAGKRGAAGAPNSGGGTRRRRRAARYCFPRQAVGRATAGLVEPESPPPGRLYVSLNRSAPSSAGGSGEHAAGAGASAWLAAGCRAPRSRRPCCSPRPAASPTRSPGWACRRRSPSRHRSSLTLWQGSWIAAWAVGIVVWGLIIWRGDLLPQALGPGAASGALQPADRDPVHGRAVHHDRCAVLLHGAGRELHRRAAAPSRCGRQRDRVPVELGVPVPAVQGAELGVRRGDRARPDVERRHARQREPASAAGDPDRGDRPVQPHLDGRHPLVLDRPVRLQARRDPRSPEPLRGDAHRRLHRDRPLHRAVRSLPQPDAVPGEDRAAGPVQEVDRGAAGAADRSMGVLSDRHPTAGPGRDRRAAQLPQGQHPRGLAVVHGPQDHRPPVPDHLVLASSWPAASWP